MRGWGKKSNTLKPRRKRNTHLECNIIVLVNRGASLQHIFWRAVFSLLVRQRRLSRGHGTAKESRSSGVLYLQDASKEEERRTVSVSDQSRAAPTSSPSERIVIYSRDTSCRGGEKGKGRKREDHTWNSTKKKHTKKTITTRWKNLSGSELRRRRVCIQQSRVR